MQANVRKEKQRNILREKYWVRHEKNTGLVPVVAESTEAPCIISAYLRSVGLNFGS